MAYDPDFGEWAREHLAAMGPLEIKRMFGGAGLYSGGLMFGILDDGVLWLKTDADLSAAFEAAGSRPLTYPAKDGTVMAMSYWSLPDTAVDDAGEATEWARRSLDIALKKAAARPARKKKA